MADQQEIAGIIANIQADVKTIVKDEIELVKAEMAPQVAAAGLLGGASYLAINAATLLFVGLSCLLSLGFASWFSLPVLGAAASGFSAAAVLLFGIAGVLVLIARPRTVFGKPESAISQAEQSVATVRGAIGAGFRQVNSLSWTGSRRQQAELE